jgi:hypothetical protein
MSVDLSGEITAIATAVLAFFAIVTAIYAIRAFRTQSQEVRDQAEMLKVQSGQLELQRRQLGDQLTEKHRAQASRVFIWTETGPAPGLTDARASHTWALAL